MGRIKQERSRISVAFLLLTFGPCGVGKALETEYLRSEIRLKYHNNNVT